MRYKGLSIQTRQDSYGTYTLSIRNERGMLIHYSTEWKDVGTAELVGMGWIDTEVANGRFYL